MGRRRANEELLDVITAELVVETCPADLEQLGRFGSISTGPREGVNDAGALG